MLSTRGRSFGGVAVLPLIVAVLAALGALMAWAVSSPPSSEADGDFHLMSSWCRSAAAEGLCPPAKRSLQASIGVRTVLPPPFRQACFAFKPEDSAACPQEPVTGARISDWLYPPLFYNYASLFARADPGGPGGGGILPMRFAVIVSVVAIFTAAYLVSLSWLRPAMVVSWVVFSMPMGASLFASINPSAWAVAGLAAMWGPMVTACNTRDPRRRWAAAAVWLVAGLMAAGARADAGIFAALVSVVGAILLLRRRQVLPLLLAAFASGAYLGLALTSGQASFAANALMEESAQPQGPMAVLWSVVLAGPTYLSALTGSTWGFVESNHLLGWFDVPMPPGVWIPNTMLLGMLGAAGLIWMPWRKVVAIAGLIGVALVIVSKALVQDQVLAGTLFSPRYLLPLALVAAGLLLVVGPSRRIELAGWPFWVAWVAAAYVGVVALHSLIRRYTTGVDVVSPNLDDRVEWWSPVWLSPNIVWLLGAACWAVLVFVALSHMRAPGRRSAGAAPGGRNVEPPPVAIAPVPTAATAVRHPGEQTAAGSEETP